jgi:hypothetical protein
MREVLVEHLGADPVIFGGRAIYECSEVAVARALARPLNADLVSSGYGLDGLGVFGFLQFLGGLTDSNSIEGGARERRPSLL